METNNLHKEELENQKIENLVPIVLKASGCGILGFLLLFSLIYLVKTGEIFLGFGTYTPIIDGLDIFICSIGFIIMFLIGLLKQFADEKNHPINKWLGKKIL